MASEQRSNQVFHVPGSRLAADSDGYPSLHLEGTIAEVKADVTNGRVLIKFAH
jgi:hypothetical protein